MYPDVPPGGAVAYPTRPGYRKFGDVRATQLIVEVAAARDQHHYDLGKRMPAYGGMKSIYTAGPLPVASKDSVVKLAEKDGPGVFVLPMAAQAHLPPPMAQASAPGGPAPSWRTSSFTKDDNGGGQWPAAAGSGSDHIILRDLPADGARAVEFVRDLLHQAAANDPYSGGQLWVRLNVKRASEYKYLNQSDCLEIDGVGDARKFHILLEVLMLFKSVRKIKNTCFHCWPQCYGWETYHFKQLTMRSMWKCWLMKAIVARKWGNAVLGDPSVYLVFTGLSHSRTALNKCVLIMQMRGCSNISTDNYISLSRRNVNWMGLIGLKLIFKTIKNA
ncbi:uncharacterized protein LOC126631056 isoform X3 [Malus sylvestris]|uniref:uncharacterized protein LOC126631056 isoform X3 n=1 Tax=Malus sylvestris TaxID=3752 RepID=UPI0021AC9971|nr:uncharacterized protein LOC126631056 isoform X3 [Malus sylvestris]